MKIPKYVYCNLLKKPLQVDVEHLQPSLGLPLLCRPPLPPRQLADPPNPLWDRELSDQVLAILVNKKNNFLKD